MKKKYELIILTTIFFGLAFFGLAFFASISSTGDCGILKEKSVNNLDQFSENLQKSGSLWTIPEVVSTESTTDSEYPSIVVDIFGNVHIAWQDLTNYSGSGTDYDIFYKYWNATTGIWNTTTVVSTESTASSGGVSIAVDIFGNVHIAWNDYTNYSEAGIDCDIFYKYWNATTGIWNTTTVVSSESIDHSFYPSIAVDGSGNVHIAWHDFTDYGGSGAEVDVFYKYWNASTGVWNTTTVVSSESTSSSYHTSIAVDGSGNVHIAWQDETNYGSSGIDFDIFYKYWNVTTGIWNTTTVVSTESTDISREPSMAVDDVGNVHITWKDFTDYGGSGTDCDIFYKYWNATTGIWNTTTVATSDDIVDQTVSSSMAVDSAGNVHIVWGDQNDIFYKYWNATIRIWNTTTIISPGVQSLEPSIAADTSNNVHVAWYVTGSNWQIYYRRTKTQTNLTLSINPDLNFYDSSNLINITIYYNEIVKDQGIDGATIGVKINGIQYTPVIFDNYDQGYYNITIECNSSEFGNYGPSVIEVNATKINFAYKSKQLNVIIIGNTNLHILWPPENLELVEGSVFDIKINFSDTERDIGINNAIISYIINDQNPRGDNIVDNGDGSYNITIDIDDPDFGGVFGGIDIKINVSKNNYINRSISYSLIRQIATSIDPGNNVNFGRIFRGETVSYEFNYTDSLSNPIEEASISPRGSTEGFTWIIIEEGNGNYTISLNSTSVIARETVYTLGFDIFVSGNETQALNIQIIVLLPKTAVVGITSNIIGNVLPEQSNLMLNFNFTDLYKNIPITTITTNNVTVKQGNSFWYEVVGQGLGDPNFLINGGWRLIHNGNGNYTLNISNYQLTLGNLYVLTIQINYTSIDSGLYNSSIINIQFYYGTTLVPPSDGNGGGGGGGGTTSTAEAPNITMIILLVIIVGFMAVAGGIVYSKKKQSQQGKKPELKEEKFLTEKIITDKGKVRLERIETQRKLSEKLVATDKFIQQKEFEFVKGELNTIIYKASAFNLKGLIKQAKSKLKSVKRLEIQDVEKKTIKKTIMELGAKYARLQISEINEISGIADEILIINTIKEMTKNKEINAEYFESSKSVVFNIQPVADDIDKLMKEYDKFEKEDKGKKKI